MKNLKLVNISKQLNNRIILNNINISINKGSIHIIEGKSGSGKSTLLSIMGGMEEPTDGYVILNGNNIYKFSDDLQASIRSDKFGFVFQSFHLLPDLSAQDNILLPVQLNNNEKDKLKLGFIANGLGIEKILNTKVKYLSGGEQQRVAIARAVINNPSIVFADEPTGNLDEYTSKKVINFLLELNKYNNTSLVIVSHQKKLISISHTKYYMENGNIHRVDVYE